MKITVKQFNLKAINKATATAFVNSFYVKLLILLIVLCLVELLRAALLQGFTRAESCFAEGSREMFLDKQYIAPLLHELPYFDKPPLHYWLIIMFYQILGVSLLNARAVSIIAAVVTTGVSAMFVRTILGKEVALLTAMILATTVGFYELGSIAMPDMLLCLFDTIVIFSAYKVFIDGSNQRSRWLLALTVSLALGWMTKGPIAILIPAMAIASSLVILKQPLHLSRKEMLQVSMIFLALVIPWHLVVYKHYGMAAFDWLYLRGNIKRFVGLDQGYNFGHSPTYILNTLLTGFLPWTLFSVPAFYKILTSIFKQREHLPHYKFLLLIMSWVICNTLLFSFSWSNWAYYSLPIYPAVAILTAYFLVGLGHRLSVQKIQLMSSAITVGFFLTTLIYALIFLPVKARQERYLNFGSEIKPVSARVPFFFHDDLVGQYLLVDLIEFETGRVPIYCNQEKLIKMSFSFQPFVALIPNYVFEELPASCKAKLKIIEIEQKHWLNFPQCKLAGKIPIGKPVSLMLISHRCPFPGVLACGAEDKNQTGPFSHWDSEREKSDGLATWWLAKAYFAEASPPDVVVLGGSQLGSLLGADAYVYNRLVDLTGDHRSYTIEHDLKLLLRKNWRVLIGPLPDGMISDQVIASRALFSSQNKPRLVVITLSPDCFIDNTVSDASSTEASTFFSKYLGPMSLHRNLADARLRKYAHPPNNNDYFENLSPLTLNEPFERISPGEITISSSDGQYFDDNIQEYQRRYQNPCSPQAIIQFGCLEILFEYLRQQNIAAVAIELPLTNANHILLPESWWKFYHKKITEICQKNDVDYWDTTSIWDDFSLSEFCDSVHLNLRGGLKLTRPIVLATAYKLHLPMYAYNGNFGPLVPGKEKIYFHKSWSDSTK